MHKQMGGRNSLIERVEGALVDALGSMEARTDFYEVSNIVSSDGSTSMHSEDMYVIHSPDTSIFASSISHPSTCPQAWKLVLWQS